MQNEIYEDTTLERSALDLFGVDFDIERVIARRLPVGRLAEATVFLTRKKQLMVYVRADARLTLADVQKIINRMGLKAEIYFPPKNRPDYFDRFGRKKFQEVFPGRNNITSEDLIFYRTLAPYQPALVLISEVKQGVIYGYDSDARGGWRPAVKFAYRRLKTS